MMTQVLIGRQSELLRLQQQFEAAGNGQLHVAFITGEPGIGKTALIDAFAARATEQGAIVLRGSASEAEGMPPYLPFLEGLGAYIRTAPLDQLRAQTALTAPVLLGLFPELAERLGEIPRDYPMPPEQARLRLYEAVGSFLTAIAVTRPLVLILDDLQWADWATMDLLVHVARSGRGSRLLVFGAYRPDEAERNPALGRAITELNRLRLLTSLTLDPLSPSEIETLAINHLGGAVAPALTSLLYTHSEGNPFFAEELLRAWSDAGALPRSAVQWTLPVSVGMPESIVGAIRQRLARQRAEVVETLRTAAIIGRRFEPRLLAQVSGQEIERVEACLREAAQARLVQSEGQVFVFQHNKIRECLYADVTASRRQRLHRIIGRALEAQPNPELAALAFHFAASGDRERGVEYSWEAADRAMAAYAPVEALGHYRTALDLLSDDDKQRGDLLLALGETAMLAGAERDSAAALQEAQAWFKQKGEAVSAARAAHRLGQTWWRLEELAAAKTAFESALSMLPDGPSSEIVQVLVDLGSLLAVSLHQQKEGIRHGRRALRFAQKLEDERLVASASRVVGNLLVRSNNLPEGLSLLEEALRLATEAGDPVEAVECCAHLCLAYAWSQQFERATEVSSRWKIFAEQCHDPYQLRHIYSVTAMENILRGEWLEAEKRLKDAQAIAERLASPEPMGVVYLIRGFMDYQRGDYGRAESELRTAISIFRSIGPAALVWYLGILAMTLAAQGKVAEAQAAMDEEESIVFALPPGIMPTAEPLADLTQAALHLNDRERLARYYPPLDAFRGQYHDAIVNRLLGAIELAQGDWDKAARSLADAEAVARRQNAQTELAHTLIAQADLELARRKRREAGREGAGRARDLLAEAAKLFQSVGNAPEERRTVERLRQLSAGQTQAYPAGLSQREAEVLRLVAQGQSNKQIAKELSLSEKTIGNHLTNIFNKLGVDNRAAATAFAIRNGLA
jgi:DNA-binding CsgD family transcriptional regulator